MRAIEGLRIGVAVAAISLLGAGAAHAGVTVTQFKANGAMASHNSFDGTTSYDLGVNRNETPSGTTTFLSFNTQTCNADFSICTGTFGFGNIPNGDFSASTAAASASLNTNLATNSGFQVFNFVLENGNFTQTPGVAAGIIAINWNKLPRDSSSMTGVQTFIFGGFSNKLTGTQTSNGARSTGTLLGRTLPTAGSSRIGTNKSSQIVISHD